MVLTHHHLRDLGTRTFVLKPGENPAIPGMAPGGGGVRDKLPCVCSVIRGKVLESSTPSQQAAANSKEQFSHSPDLKKALLDAIIGALDAHQLMSNQALNSEDVREDLRDQGLKE
ncbi:MAG: hypothetical protein ACK41W_05310 [Cyanobacteriota bacterium]